MSSLLTNASAMTALQTLSTINKNLATTQERISTGLRVNTASDNAAYWSIATTMRSDNKALSSVQDALGLGAGKLDTAYTGMNEVIDAVDEIKQKIVLGLGASTNDQDKLKTEIEALQEHIKSVIKNSNYAGTNILSTPTNLKIVASYNRNDTAVTPDIIELTGGDFHLATIGEDGAASGGLIGDDILASDFVSWETDDGMLSKIEEALGSLATAASKLGAAKSRVDLQKEFVSKLSDAIDRGVGQLVDADMNAESARLSALQVQQQLGIQALSIANSNSQNILALFR